MAGDYDSLSALFLTVFVAGVTLLPATICLGGSFPALAEARRRAYLNEIPTRGLGRLYAANTIGASFGVLFSVYLLLPTVALVGGSLVLETQF